MVSDLTSGRILIVDDEAHTRNLLRELAESWGYASLVAEDGEQALTLIKEKPDLVLLDLMMPKIDGFEVLKRLRAEEATRALPVILLTAAGEVSDKIRAMELGADDYVTKPFRIVELQHRVVAALDRRRSLAPPETARSPLPTDPVTGVGTFPQLRETITYEVERSRRYNRPLTVLFVGIDHPPLIFDQPGRDGARQVLVQLAQALRRNFRAADRVYRLDVEAFVVLLPETTLEGARQAALRFTNLLRETPLPVPGETRTVTVSIGISDFPRLGSSSANELIRTAHSALTSAQNAGASNVEVAPNNKTS